MIAEHDDPRVIAAVEEYLAALEAGHPLDVNAFLKAHADVAGPLGECLAGLQLVHGAAPSLQGEKALPGDAEPLGDYRLVREIGRGGMGVVYEAMQLSLGRRVALKVLPFAAALDPRQLQRFKNEAQAAAHLNHPNIVPVHAVGCERGVHYYAMQFIDGRSLASLIDELRSASPLPRFGGEGLGVRAREETSPLTPAPSPPKRGRGEKEGTTVAAALSTQRDGNRGDFFRAAAALGVKAARALDHAHQLGVIHRDVKPANLMLDTTGNLWVTDFGLALVQNDAGLTRSGELLGTLRYMSPEQALSKPAVVDHRTDVYSLGATLYELLTLQPVFAGQDRQELLRQIAFEEPAPPRKHDPALPAELETIVLKALAKTPVERYGTAGELADDLERFLNDQPIRARRPSLAERAGKWARRHRAVVVSAVVLLLLLVAGLGASTLLVAAAYDRERERADEARRQRSRAEESFRRAKEAVDFLVQISEEELADRPNLQHVRRRVLEAALLYYQDFLAERGDDPALQEELAAAKERVTLIVGDLVTLQGRHELTLVHLREVHDALRLTPEQRRQVIDLGRLAPGRRREDVEELRGLSLAERQKRLVEQTRAYEQAVAKILTPQQAQRLKQIGLQQKGPAAFLDPAVADALQLTAKQKEAVRKVLDEAGPPRVRLEELRFARQRIETYFRETTARLVALLTPAQKKRWQEMVGEPVPVPFRPPLEGPLLPPWAGPPT